MKLKTVFSFYEVEQPFESDEVFEYHLGSDSRDGLPVLLAIVKTRWRTNQSFLSELEECVRQTMSLTRKEIAKIRGFERSPTDGIAIVMERPGVSQIIKTDPPPFERTADAACEALHSLHTKKLYWGCLSPSALWWTGREVRLSGIGYSPALKHGWREKQDFIAPELLNGSQPNIQSDIYSLAKVLKTIYPGIGKSVQAALDASPERRPEKARHFRSILAVEDDPSTNTNSSKGSASSVVPVAHSVPYTGSSTPPAYPTTPPSTSDASTPIPNRSNAPADPYERLREEIDRHVFDGYCDTHLEEELIDYGVDNCGLKRVDANAAVTIELQQRCITSEKSRLKSFRSLLTQYSQKKRKLSKKERADAVQMICRPQPGYKKGLSYQRAIQELEKFCTTNGIKKSIF